MEKDTTYYIKDVAEITGLSEQLIRKWENRYQIVNPERLPNGYRVYSPKDVATLKQIKQLRDEKVSMKNAIQIIVKNKKEEKVKKYLYNVEESPYIEQLVKKGTVYEEEGIRILLKQAHHQYGLALFLQNTVRPFLEEIGHLWEKKTWDESQESLSSLAVRDYLSEIDRDFQVPDGAPTVLGFCLPGELHEIPLQILLLQMKMEGWHTTRIGASPKLTAIEKLIEFRKPDKVVLSASTHIPFQQTNDLVQYLDKIAEKNEEIDFYIGGHGLWEYTAIIKPQFLNIVFTVKEIIKNN